MKKPISHFINMLRDDFIKINDGLVPNVLIVSKTFYARMHSDCPGFRDNEDFPDGIYEGMKVEVVNWRTKISKLETYMKVTRRCLPVCWGKGIYKQTRSK